MSLQCFVGGICISHLSHQIINWLLGKHWFPRFCVITMHGELTQLPVGSVYLLTGLHARLSASCLHSQLGSGCQHILSMKTNANVAGTLFVLLAQGCVRGEQTGRGGGGAGACWCCGVRRGALRWGTRG